MKKAAIIGATGFGGLGLIEIMLKHPHLKPTQLFARKETGIPISDVFPHLSPYTSQVVKDISEINYDEIDIAFFSTPDQAGMEMIKPFKDRNIPVIDFSGDFRFNSLEDYHVYAVNKSMTPEHLSPELMKESVYGLCELNRDKIKNAIVVGNPGCFAMSMILGLLPLTRNGIITPGTVVVDSKSGVSGAGKNPGAANFYPQRYENINTYREGKHQHLVEVEKTVNNGAKSEIKIFFVPQVIPIARGILSNIYADCAKEYSNKELFEIFSEFYKNEPFVRITEKSPNLTDVRGTNFCLIRPLFDKRTGKILVTSVIDNLLKGQSGNAIQVANIMLGFDERDGLTSSGMYP